MAWQGRVELSGELSPAPYPPLAPGSFLRGRWLARLNALSASGEGRRGYPG
jgi:hypothetical protein